VVVVRVSAAVVGRGVLGRTDRSASHGHGRGHVGEGDVEGGGAGGAVAVGGRHHHVVGTALVARARPTPGAIMIVSDTRAGHADRVVVVRVGAAVRGGHVLRGADRSTGRGHRRGHVSEGDVEGGGAG